MNKEELISAIKELFPQIENLPESLEATVERMLDEDNHGIDRERFNIILSTWRLPPASRGFFRHYFNDRIESAEDLKSGVNQFIKDALWHFGEVNRGYNAFCKIDVAEYITKHQFDLEEFKARLPWTMVDDIEPNERGFLGYVSGQRPYKQKDMLSTTERILQELDENHSQYAGKGPAEVEKIIFEKFTEEERLKLKGLEEEEIDLFKMSEIEANRATVEKRQKQVEETIEKVERLKKIGENNQIQYLRNIEMIDVYVATSMRDDKEYIEMADFVSSVFGDDDVKSLNLRYFDPTLCFCESRIDKGIIECLLVRTAKVTIYCAQDGDTFGKDSELAATLCQGKPVIVYVPEGDDSDLERKEKLNGRAKVFQDFHPLGLQVGLYDGVARGVIVVRTPEQCSRVLFQLLTNSLEVDLTSEQHGLTLRERSTKSVVRVMTGWGELAHAFWNNFGISVSPKTGRPD